MSLLKEFKLLSKYNQLMNHRLFEAVAQLPDKSIKADRGAFFKSLLGTLNHILVGDIIWLKRFSTDPSSHDSLLYFANIEKPESLNSTLFSEFDELAKEREKIDGIIIEWVASLTEESIKSTVSYQNMNGVLFKKDFSSLINHLFLHQVYHRGQATTLLSQFGVDFGDTDIIEIVEDVL